MPLVEIEVRLSSWRQEDVCIRLPPADKASRGREIEGHEREGDVRLEKSLIPVKWDDVEETIPLAVVDL